MTVIFWSLICGIVAYYTYHLLTECLSGEYEIREEGMIIHRAGTTSVRFPRLLACRACHGTGKLHFQHGDDRDCDSACLGVCGVCEGWGKQWRR